MGYPKKKANDITSTSEADDDIELNDVPPASAVLPNPINPSSTNPNPNPEQNPPTTSSLPTPADLPTWITHPDPNGPKYDFSGISPKFLIDQDPPNPLNPRKVSDFHNYLNNLRKRTLHEEKLLSAPLAVQEKYAKTRAQKAMRIAMYKTRKPRERSQKQIERRERRRAEFKTFGKLMKGMGKMELLDKATKGGDDNGISADTNSKTQNSESMTVDEEFYARRRAGEIVTTVNGDQWNGGFVERDGFGFEKGGKHDDDDDEMIM